MKGLNLILLLILGVSFALLSFGCAEIEQWDDNLTDPRLGFTIKPPIGFVMNGNGGEPNSEDALIVEYLKAKYTVTYFDSDNGAPDMTAAALQDGMVISYSIGSGYATPFRKFAKPTLCYETWSMRQNVLGFVAINDATDNSFNSSGETSISIVNASHPLAGGLTGNVNVGAELGFIVPGAATNCTKIATMVGNADQVVIGVFDTGATLYNAVDVADGSEKTAAPTAFVGFNWVQPINSNGLGLIGAAVEWLVPIPEE